jgi:hypothetical protein
MPGQIRRDSGFYRLEESITAFVVANSRTISYVTSTLPSWARIRRGADDGRLLSDLGGGYDVTAPPPETGPHRDWVLHTFENRPGDINRLRRSED